MHIQLFKVADHLDEFAVSKVGSFIVGGAFFLDFSRPLEVHRWLGIRNRWIGFAGAALVPIVHECEESGGYVIYVGRSDPYFKDVRDLWRKRYPSRKPPPVKKVDGLQIIADFARQFPEDARTP